MSGVDIRTLQMHHGVALPLPLPPVRLLTVKSFGRRRLQLIVHNGPTSPASPLHTLNPWAVRGKLAGNCSALHTQTPIPLLNYMLYTVHSCTTNCSVPASYIHMRQGSSKPTHVHPPHTAASSRPTVDKALTRRVMKLKRRTNSAQTGAPGAHRPLVERRSCTPSLHRSSVGSRTTAALEHKAQQSTHTSEASVMTHTHTHAWDRRPS